jgi:hypothetical protein
MCKLMETIIKDQIVQFLADKGLINKYQHAFKMHHSAAIVTSCMASLHDWPIGLNSHLRTDIVYILRLDRSVQVTVKT